MHLKLPQKNIQKAAEATGVSIGNKISDKITKVSRTSLQNSSGATSIETENIRLDREIPKEGYKKKDTQL